MNQIVIIGISHHNTLGVIRALGRKGLSEQIHLFLIGKNDYISCSRYISNKRLFRIQNEDSLVETLIESNIGTPETPAIVICCSDSSIAALDTSRHLLCSRFIIPSASSEYGGVHGLMGKDEQASIAEECNLRIPNSLVLDINGGNYLYSIDNWNNYPCILKPIDSIQGHKTDIHICPNKTSLFSDVKSSSCTKFIVQKFIEKDFEFQLIGCSLKKGNKIVIPGYTRIIRQPENTNTGFLQYNPINTLDLDDTLHSVYSFIKKIGYSGLFSVEFLRGKDGVDYFMEINMRNDGNAICVTDAGINLPYIWYAYNAGINFEDEAAKEVDRLFCMPEFDDVVFVFKRQLSLFEWIKDVRKTTSFMEYCKDDKRPFFKRLKNFIVFLFIRFFKSFSN